MQIGIRAAGRLGIVLCLVVHTTGAHAADLDASQLGALWALPFVGMLLSIALMPLFLPFIWHKHYGKVAAGWALLLLLPMGLQFGAGATGSLLMHTVLEEYVPFVILLTALFTVAGGIFIRGNLHGSPALNTGLLAAGAVLASLMGTTGASMLLIRPLIRANDNRRHRTHVVVFFIFIVSNVGGALTPLGDPPLFLGFLKGVDFFWTAKALIGPTAFVVGSLLAIFFLIDSYYYRQGDEVRPTDPTPDSHTFGLQGVVNLVLLGVVIGLVLLSGTWKSELQWSVGGATVTLPGLVRDLGLIAVIAASLWLTPARVHEANQFEWGPMLEVAKLFAGIFATMIPVMAMLKLGLHGPFGPLVALTTHADGTPNPAMYFWLTGALSSFLDNAPTYLVFFNLAGGDAQQLMTTLSPVLVAVSAGAVFMGANTYIGNAPNLMVKAIAESRHVAMPSFFGYMAWSGLILLPLFGVVTLIWM